MIYEKIISMLSNKYGPHVVVHYTSSCVEMRKFLTYELFAKGNCKNTILLASDNNCMLGMGDCIVIKSECVISMSLVYDILNPLFDKALDLDTRYSIVIGSMKQAIKYLKNMENIFNKKEL